eukprot:11725638-Karenia_brevis.AAC.1
MASSSISNLIAPGSNDWLLALPTCRKHAFPDDAARALQRWRLWSRMVENGSECAYVVRAHNQ